MRYSTLLFVFLILTVPSICQSQSINLNFGLQAHYPFNGNANDETNNGYDGTLYGSPSLTTDRFGNQNSAYQFDGVDDYINTFSTFDYTERSVSLWVNTYDMSGSGTTSKVVITQDDDNLNSGKLRVHFGNGELNMYAGGLNGMYNTSNVSTNNWMHLVLIRDGATNRYYVNNTLVHTAPADGIGSTNPGVPEFIIGAGRETIIQFFEGKIDDIRVYDRAINTCEIAALYGANPIDLDNDLQAYYPFNGNAIDETNNGYDGTLYGSPSLTTDRFGNQNSAYEFDGLDDYINTFSTFDYLYRSVSLWVNPYNLSGSGTTSKVVITQDDDNLNSGKLRVHFGNGDLNMYAGGLNGMYNTSNVSTNNWMHLVLIRDGATNKYYINNSLVHTAPADGIGSTNPGVPEFIIGAGRETIIQFFEGKIDDIRVYNRVINECEIDSLYTIGTLGVSDVSIKDSDGVISVYPNPVSNSLNVATTGKNTITHLQIADAQGKVLKAADFNNSHLQTINLSDFTKGIYFIRITLKDGNKVTRKFIKH